MESRIPESAEVRRLVDSLQPIVGSTIVGTKVLTGPHAHTPIVGFGRLGGYQVHDITSKGRLIIVGLRSTGFVAVELNLLLTIGATGWWHLSDGSIILPDRFALGSFDPTHARYRINLERHSLIFTDASNQGTIKVTTNAGLRKELAELGLDVSVVSQTVDEAAQRHARYEQFGEGKTVAELLLDQRVFCGSCNHLRADAMYMAKIDPRTPALELTMAQISHLWHWCTVVASAGYYNVGIGGISGGYTSPCYRRKVDSCNNPIESYEDSTGHAVWWCPTVQAA